MRRSAWGLHRDGRGYTMTFWALFIGFVLIPALVSRSGDFVLNSSV